MLVLAAASVRADDLHLDVMQDELLSGEYYPDYSNSSWYIKFSVKVEGEDIVSACEIWSKKEGYLVEMTSLKIPYRNKYTSKIDHMHTRVISAAKATAQVLKLSWLLFATVDDIVEAYWNMADSLANKTKDMGINQVRFAVMYHSIIIGAALRIMNGARKTKDICQASPDYEYAESTSLFICTQDLPHFNQSLVPHERQQRSILDCSDGDGDGDGGDDDDDMNGSGLDSSSDNCTEDRYPRGGGLRGSDRGCCSNYKGCCRLALCICYKHDRACTCCSHWWCLWKCKCDSDCDPVTHPQCSSETTSNN